MRLVEFTCGNCSAQLDIDLDHLQAYCPFCGKKLMMDFDKLDRVLTEKEKTKRTVEQETQQTKRTLLAYEHDQKKLEYSTKQKDKEMRRTGFGLLVMLLIPLLIFLPDRISHGQKVAYLQAIEINVENAIQEKDYDTALFNANKIYLDDNWSSKEIAAWDAKRVAYIEIITAKKLEVDLNNPDNVFMPASSDSFEGKKYTEVVDQLKALGFTNITTQVAYEPAAFFSRKDGTVEHILIGGKTNFTTEDFFKKVTPIIIYYYSK